MSRNLSSPPNGRLEHHNPQPENGCRVVVPLNEEAALYLTLAEEIAGTAVGMSSQAQRLLRQGLIDRFGEIFSAHGNDVLDELLRLATEPQAA